MMGEQEKMRMDAYYYGFCHTGELAVDRILSAVACAGKALHHTDEWITYKVESDYGHGENMTPIEWIELRADEAAKAFATLRAENEALRAERDTLAKKLDGMQRTMEAAPFAFASVIDPSRDYTIVCLEEKLERSDKERASIEDARMATLAKADELRVELAAVKAERDHLRKCADEWMAECDKLRPALDMALSAETGAAEELTQIRADLAQCKAALAATQDVVSSACELVSWDWLHLLADHEDSDTVTDDVKRLDGALAALDEQAATSALTDQRAAHLERENAERALTPIDHRAMRRWALDEAERLLRVTGATRVDIIDTYVRVERAYVSTDAGTLADAIDGLEGNSSDIPNGSTCKDGLQVGREIQGEPAAPAVDAIDGLEGDNA